MVSDGKNPKGALLSCQKLLGYKVENPRGEGLGRIEDVMISAEGGQVAYAVVSFGGILGLGNKLFAFPWSVLRVDGPGRKVMLDLDRKALAQSRGFEKDHWPEASEWNWGVPAPLPSEPAADRVEPPPPPAPVFSGPPARESAPSGGNRIEHWGESWQSHGLDRS